MNTCIRFVVAATVSVGYFSGLLLADGRFADARLLVGKQQIEGALVSDAKKKEVSFDAGGTNSFQIPYENIKAIHYERTAKPRYAAAVLVAWPLIFTKSKQHYLTLQYADGTGDGKFQIVRLDKENVRIALETLEADTGLTVDRSEER